MYVSVVDLMALLFLSMLVVGGVMDFRAAWIEGQRKRRLKSILT